MDDTLVKAAVSEIPKFASGLILLGLAWLVTQRVTVFWNLRQKQKENDLSTARDFHAIYGEFFAIWKLWNYYVRDVPELRQLSEASRWALLDRACIAEGKLETTLVRLVSEKALEPDDVEILGQFRQLYQELRESIRDDQPLPWDSSNDPHYVAFKERAPKIAGLIVGKDKINSKKLFDITSNQYEVWRDNLARSPPLHHGLTPPC
jgi:hypothetical protein